MRAIIRAILLKPVLWIAGRTSSIPDRKRIFKALTTLKKKLENAPWNVGAVIPFDFRQGRMIILSDQHKGAKDGADDFMSSEGNYLGAMRHYDQQGFHFISLGDSEELWENTIFQVKRHNQPAFAAERKFALRKSFTKIFGNHDLEWAMNPLAALELKQLYGATVRIHEGVLLQATIKGKLITIFCTHGHQGDALSDGNFFSKFIVSAIWAPLQAYLRINPNTPANNTTLKTAHNRMMYEWSSQQKDLLLITGHTHQPVFGSLTHLERLQQQRPSTGGDAAHHGTNYRVKPTYFNTGCCCFDDGDITGIEIAEGAISLIKWGSKDGIAVRTVMESADLEALVTQLD